MGQLGMNKEDIIRLAREAELWEMLEGYSNEYVSGNAEEDCLPDLERFAALVAAHEREECAKVCEAEGQRIDASWSSCAAAIRSRT